MARPISDKLRVYLDQTESDSSGVSLGRACIQAQLPIIHLARALGVSRWTVHKWFRGEPVAQRYRPNVKSAFNRIQQGLQTNELPIKNKADAKNFIEANIR